MGVGVRRAPGGARNLQSAGSVLATKSAQYSSTEGSTDANEVDASVVTIKAATPRPENTMLTTLAGWSLGVVQQ